jgi:hypothetical protein
MPGMKVTVDAAMRARDVSRPRPEQDAAAEAAVADLPALRTAPGTRVMPVPSSAAPRGPAGARAVPAGARAVPAGGPPRHRPGPPVPGPTGQPAPRESNAARGNQRPAPPPQPAVAPPPAPAGEPSTVPNAPAAHPGPERETGDHQAGEPAPTGPERGEHGGPAAARPARRKRVRRRRSHGH